VFRVDICGELLSELSGKEVNDLKKFFLFNTNFTVVNELFTDRLLLSA